MQHVIQTHFVCMFPALKDKSGGGGVFINFVHNHIVLQSQYCKNKIAVLNQSERSVPLLSLHIFILHGSPIGVYNPWTD